MEAPLTACEFLKRFHLPQLVRISQDGGCLHKLTNVDKALSSTASAFEADQANGANQNDSMPAKSTNWTSSVGSTVAKGAFVNQSDSARLSRQQHEKSEWTYRPALRHFSGQTNDTVNDTVDERFRTSLVTASKLKQQTGDAHLSRETMRQEELRLLAGSERSAKRSVDFEPALSKGQYSSVNLGKQANAVEEQQEQQYRREDNIRLVPPSKRPALSKLQLNQPFLLYKAYKKLELCAYVIDLKNELNEKSGDPIFFPQNYPGKCAQEELASLSLAMLIVASVCVCVCLCCFSWS